jgi:hypothetical protein
VMFVHLFFVYGWTMHLYLVGPATGTSFFFSILFFIIIIFRFCFWSEIWSGLYAYTFGRGVLCISEWVKVRSGYVDWEGEVERKKGVAKRGGRSRRETVPDGQSVVRRVVLFVDLQIVQG